MNWDNPEERAALLERVGPEEYKKLYFDNRIKTVAVTVAGHAIRPVQTQRFGRLFAVGDTDRAFPTLADAEKFASENPVKTPLDDLTAEYAAWNKAQGLDLGSADEHLFDESLTEDQRKWVRDFSRRWDEAAAAEHDARKA